MAKQTSIIKVTGKIGDIVGMKNGFGTSALAFARKKAEVVSNPQSNTQMLQRIKMLPAVLVRRQLESVIRRAWQGTKYGGQSMREFMKYAMKMPLSDVPQIEKDSANPIPGPYMISKGSLAPIECRVESLGTAKLIIQLNGSEQTVGAISTAMIEQALAKEGDQITLVFARKLASGFIRWDVCSFYVESASTALMDDLFQTQRISVTNEETDLLFTDTSSSPIVAFTAVVSREGSTPLRSTATLAVNKTILQEFFGSTIKANVLESYKTATSSSRTSTDWPYDDDAEAPVETEDGEYTLSGLTGAAAAKNGTKVKVKYIAGTEELYAVYAYTNEDSPLVGSQPFCVGTNGQPVSYTDSGDETGLSVSAVAAFAGLRQIAVS